MLVRRPARLFIAASLALMTWVDAGPARADVVLRAIGELAEHAGPASQAEYSLHIEGGASAIASAHRLQLELPGLRFVAERSEVVRQPRGMYWSGRLAGGGDLLITVRDGLVSGVVNTRGQTYEVMPGPGGPRLAVLEDSRFPLCTADQLDEPTGLGRLVPPPASDLAGDEASSVFDVLVFYTRAARDQAGGVAQIQALIQSAVNVTNTAYDNSNIDAQLELIHMARAPFPDTGSSSTELNALRTSTTVAALRDLYGADVVTVITESNGTCGLGSVQRNPGPAFASRAHSVVVRGCAVGNMTFAHELGHNMGCEHDPANGTEPSNASYPFAYGHFHSGAYRTVMSYSSECSSSCPRAQHFSNSNVQHQGLVTGILDERENYRTINNTRIFVQDFRPRGVSISFDSALYLVREGEGVVDLRVQRTGPVDVDVSAVLTSSSGTAIAGLDYQAVTTTLTWASGDGSPRTVSLPLIDDDEVEPLEELEVSLSGFVRAGPGAAPTARIRIDDPENGIIEVDGTNVEVREDDPQVTIEVRRVAGDLGAVQVDYAATGITATADQDFVPVSGQLSWANGELGPKTFSVPLLDDNDVEGLEVIEIALSNPTGGARLGVSRDQIIVRDWEEGFIGFGAAEAAVAENQRSLRLRIDRSSGADGEVQVQVSAAALPPAGAQPDVDFSLRADTVRFPSGAVSAFVEVDVLDDRLIEDDERFEVQIISLLGGATLGPQASTEVTITDVEEGTLRFVEGELSVPEDAGPAVLTVSRTDGAAGSAQLRYEVVSLTARGGVDYRGTSTGTLRWADGEVEARTIEVDLVDDDLVEGPETFAVRLFAAVGAHLTPATTATVTIVDREPGALTLDAERLRVGEDAGSVQVELRREGGNQGAVEVPWTLVEDTAEAGADFVAAQGALTWADGEQGAKAIEITLLDDDVREGEERFFIELGPVEGQASLPMASVQVLLEDAGPGTVELLGAPDAVAEGRGAVRMRLVRTGEARGPLEVTVRAVSDSAEAGADFEALSRGLQWGDGQTGELTFALQLLDDAVHEPAERLTLEFESETAGASLPEPLVLTITDDDPAPELVEDGGCRCLGSGEGIWGTAWLWLGLLGLRRRPRD